MSQPPQAPIKQYPDGHGKQGPCPECGVMVYYWFSLNKNKWYYSNSNNNRDYHNHPKNPTPAGGQTAVPAPQNPTPYQQSVANHTLPGYTATDPALHGFDLNKMSYDDILALAEKKKEAELKNAPVDRAFMLDGFEAMGNDLKAILKQLDWLSAHLDTLTTKVEALAHHQFELENKMTGTIVSNLQHIFASKKNLVKWFDEIDKDKDKSD